MNLYNYTNHVLCTNERIGMFNIQCTISNTYIQFQRTVPSITFDNTIIYYIDNELYLTENRIVMLSENNVIKHVGLIYNNTINWSYGICITKDMYIQNDIPNNKLSKKAIAAAILNNLK